MNLNPAINPSDNFSSGESDLSGIRVLIVDDEPDARDLFVILLNLQGAEVMAVGTATEALTAVELFQPDVLVSDIGMPYIDGYYLMEKIRALPPEKGGQIPAIALTAYAGEIEQQRSLTAGFQQHITKPIEPLQLIQAVVTLAKEKQGGSFPI